MTEESDSSICVGDTSSNNASEYDPNKLGRVVIRAGNPLCEACEARSGHHWVIMGDGRRPYMKCSQCGRIERERKRNNRKK